MKQNPLPMPISEDVKEDLLLACRYGDLDDVQAFVREHGELALTEIRDENRNSILHMICANGHFELLNFVLTLVPSNLLAEPNESGSTPLHWAALNKQLEVAKTLVQHPRGPGRDLIDVKNKFGRSPLGEAELAGWDEGAKFFVEMMSLDAEDSGEEHAEGDANFEGSKMSDIEVEIQDADGQVARLTLRDSTQLHSQSTSI